MKKLTFNDLEKGKIYFDEHSEYADIIFIEMRNNQIATFKACIYDDEQGDFIATDITVYLTANEVAKLKV